MLTGDVLKVNGRTPEGKLTILKHGSLWQVLPKCFPYLIAESMNTGIVKRLNDRDFEIVDTYEQVNRINETDETSC